MLSHFFWDFDGTLFDTYPAISRACVEVLSRFGVRLSPEEALRDTQISWGYALDLYRQRYQLDDSIIAMVHDLRRQLEEEMARPFPGAREALEGVLNRGGKHYLYTHRDNSALFFLRRFDLYDCFTDFVTSEHGFPRKPRPDALLYLMERHGIPLENAVMIGDREIDLMSGKNAGCFSCWFGEEEKRPSCADFSISRLEDVLLLQKD